MRIRKIDDDTLQRMLSEGKSQTEAAKFFNVSDAAISKRVKKWNPPEEPESFNNLTDKEKKFVLAKVKGKSNTAAALDSYDCGSIGSAQTIGQRLGADPDINRAITDLMHESGIGRRVRIKRLADLVNARDLGIAGKGLDMSFKLDGSYAAQQIDVFVSYDPFAMRTQIEELRRMLAETMDNTNVINI
ncbi:MAG: hypothetical protein NTV01_07015 [Bacteroidia bacterium]|nr:hypothetical protein [Bacteroidia bacterium]